MFDFISVQKLITFCRYFCIYLTVSLLIIFCNDFIFVEDSRFLFRIFFYNSFFVCFMNSECSKLMLLKNFYLFLVLLICLRSYFQVYPQYFSYITHIDYLIYFFYYDLRCLSYLEHFLHWSIEILFQYYYFYY